MGHIHFRKAVYDKSYSKMEFGLFVFVRESDLTVLLSCRLLKLANHELVRTRVLFKDTIEIAHIIGAKTSGNANGNRSRLSMLLMILFYSEAAGQ